MSNIYNEFKKQIGYANVTNQYVEILTRTWETEHKETSIEDAAKNVNLKLSSLPVNLSVQISRQYIVGIHTCVEEFLLKFKDLAGSPTYKKKYSAKKDISRLKWTVECCYTHVDDEIKELLGICEYYRLMRNRIVHGDEKSLSEIKSIRSSIKMTNEILKTKVYGNLQGLNGFEDISFDDQVLFSRAAICLIEKIFKESKYDWAYVLEVNREEIEQIASHVSDNKRKKIKKIKKYLSGIYYISKSNEILLDDFFND